MTGFLRSYIFLFLFSCSWNSVAEDATVTPAGEAATPVRKPFVHSALGEGQTLPKSVWRVRAVGKFLSGDRGFDENKKPVDLGIKLKADVAAMVVEHGLTDRLTFQIMVPYISRNRIGVDADRFRESARYREKKQLVLEKMIQEMKGILCSDDHSCLKLIQSGYLLPYGKTVTLPTGETIVFNGHSSIDTVADSLVLNAARQDSGLIGLGDIELGTLYNVLRTEQFIVSFGLGVRAPTGSGPDIPDAYRATGDGIYDFGLRGNLDYAPVDGVWLSWQEQHETALTQATKRRSSLLYTDKFNEQTPTDGKKNTAIFKKEGIKRTGFLQASHGLGIWHQHLKAFVIQTRYGYIFDRIVYLDGESTGAPARLYTGSVGASIDGRGYDIPLAFDTNYEFPVAGKNVKIAPSAITMTLKAYLRF